MQWSEIAMWLADADERPLVLLDGRAHVRMLNAAMATLLGASRDAAIGKSFAALCGHAEQREADDALATVLRGEQSRYEREAITQAGKRLMLTFQARSVPQQAGTLLALEHARTVLDASCPRGDRHLRFEIHSTVADFGRLLWIHDDASEGRPSEATGRCYEVLDKRSSPCPHCPALRPVEPWPRTSVRDRGAGIYELLTAEIASASTLRITLRSVTEGMLSAIHEAKLKTLAERAGLSERERAVLQYLLMGRSIDDIATILEIGRRTVKFHQANLLTKLGADSRSDLLRLVF